MNYKLDHFYIKNNDDCFWWTDKHVYIEKIKVSWTKFHYFLWGRGQIFKGRQKKVCFSKECFIQNHKILKQYFEGIFGECQERHVLKGVIPREHKV